MVTPETFCPTTCCLRVELHELFAVYFSRDEAPNLLPTDPQRFLYCHCNLEWIMVEVPQCLCLLNICPLGELSEMLK